MAIYENNETVTESLLLIVETYATKIDAWRIYKPNLNFLYHLFYCRGMSVAAECHVCKPWKLATKVLVYADGKKFSVIILYELL